MQKLRYFISTLLVATAVSANALSVKTLSATERDNIKYQRILRIQKERTVSHLPVWSIYLGTDLGGSVPEFKYIPKVFTASPSVHLSNGMHLEVPLTQHWSITSGFEYKKITLDAGAYVENMHAYVPQEGGEAPLSQYFTGSAVMEENFTMYEIPVYVSYKIRGEDGHSRIFFGGYGAWIKEASFNTVPTKGYIGDSPDLVDDGYNIQERDEKVAMDFKSVMSKWDAGITLGYEFKVYRVTLGVRAEFGFNDIFKKDCFPDNPELAKCLEFRLTHMRGGLYVAYDIYSRKGWWYNHKGK